MADDNSSYITRSVGEPGTQEHRAFISFNGHAVSALHDIPLLPPNGGHSPSETLASTQPQGQELTLNMVVECPRWTSAQMVLSTTEPFAPIRQATKGRRLAYVRSVFPHHGYLWNYGSLPQTWSEGAPLHACEIGERIAQVGDVRRVRVLGIMAPRDEGVLCWTLLVVDVADPLAKHLHSIADVDRQCPGLLTATKEWFRLYKLPDAKGENTFDLNGEVKGTALARDIVRMSNESWRNLVTSSAMQSPVVDMTNVTIRNSPGLVEIPEADRNEAFAASEPGIGVAPAPPNSATKWWYIGSR
ncbi:inorganic diphosphatase [Mycena amicta]|nr:inorganic diphosphatase [Mycena amicta]